MKGFRTRVWKIARPLSVDDVEDAAGLLTATASGGWAAAKTARKVIMFPKIVPAYVARAKRMMDAGHAVLLVSKPHRT
jgi:hypothetical protein